MKKYLSAIAGLFFVFSGHVNAAPDFEIVQKNVSQKLGMKVFSVADAPLDGQSLYQVSTERGLLYMSADLRYLFFGKIYDINNSFKDLTEGALTGIRTERLKVLQDSTIDFVADKQKHEIYVFTDVSCGYCRKLHHEISTYLDKGITVRYLAFPRGGARSQAFSTMNNVWCAKDPAEAMTTAKNQQAVAEAKCDSPVSSHYAIGSEFAVSGTPAIVLSNGELISGYVPAERLIKTLDARG